MKRISYLIAPALLLIAAGSAHANYPILDLIANNVVQKYQQSTCEQILVQKSAPKTDSEQKAIAILKSDPQMRTAFVNKVAPTIVNKMFECGMIP